MALSIGWRGPATGALLLAAWVGPVVAQAPRQAVTYPLRMIDLSVVADTVAGLQVLVQPGSDVKHSGEGSLVWLRFDPDSLLDWINSAFAALRTAAPGTAPKGIQWSRTLLPIGGKGGLALGRSRKNQSLESDRWLAIGDSALGWQAPISGTEADSLLRLFMALGTVSRIDTSSDAPSDSSRVDTPAAIDHRWYLGTTELSGRVMGQFVVGVDGRVEPGSFAVLFASDPGLVKLASAALSGATYHPAQRGGRPVRQLVRQGFYWKGQGNP